MSGLISSIQSAPELWGTFDALDAGTPSSTSTPTLRGPYIGREAAAFSIGEGSGSTVYTVGTDAFDMPFTITVGGETVASGVMSVPASYTPGDEIGLGSFGLSVELSAGNINTGDAWSTTLNPERRVRRDHVQIATDGLPVDMVVLNDRINDIDEYFTSHDGRTYRQARALLREPSIALDWLEPESEDRMQRILHGRHPVTIFENYDADTLLSNHMQRGRGSIVGPSFSVVRGSTGSYVDPDSGLLKIAASNVPRFEAGRSGRAVLQEKAITNLLPRSHPESGALGWTANGTGTTVVFDTSVPGVLDPLDEGWREGARAGSARAYVPTGGANHLNSGGFAVSAATEYVASFWLKGRGSVRLTLRTGVGSPTTTTASGEITLSREWTRYEIVGTSGVGHNQGDITIGVDGGSDTDAIVYISGCQVETGDKATSLIETAGASAARSADTLNFPQALPGDEGTLSFLFYWPGGDSGTTYTLVDATGTSGTQRFRVLLLPTVNLITLQCESSAAANTQSYTLTQGWHHFVFTWSTGAGDDLATSIYAERALLGSTDVVWEDGFGTGFDLGDSLSQGERFQAVRVDNRAWTLAEVERQYDRLTAEYWISHQKNYGGRNFWVAGYDASWLDAAVPGKKIARLDLIEANSDDDALFYAR